MKNTKSQYSLKVSLHGMNERIQKMMVTYLKLACNGNAQVVEENEAEVEIIDVDLAPSKTLLQERKEQSPSKPLIVLSLQDISSDEIIFIKKPLEVEKMLDALATARKNLSNKVVVRKKATDLRRDSKNNTVGKKIIIDHSRHFSMTKPALPSSGAEVETFFDRQASPNKKSFLGGPEFFKASKNRRQTTRYIFRAINGHLIKKTLLGSGNDLPALVLIISSKGALIRLNEPLKLGSKVILGIKFSLQNTFSIPAEVIRESNKNMYGLAFAVHQHGLTEYLINSGRPFKF